MASFSRSFRPLLIASGAVWLSLCASSATVEAAPSPTEKAAAEALFQEGKALMNKGEYERACPKLEESQRVDPQPGTLLSLAYCHESAGLVASAWIEYQEALALAKKARRADRIQLATSRLAALQKAVPRMTLEVDDTTAPEGLVITRNDVEVGKGAWGVPVPLDPGEYALTASAPGHVSWKVRVRIGMGETKNIPVPALERETPPPTASSSAPVLAPPPVDSKPSASHATWGWVVGGAGLATLAVGGYFGLRALSKDAESEDFCEGAACDARGVDLNRDARRAANVANVLVPLGLVGLGVGTWLIVGSAGKSPPAQGAARPALHLSAGWVPGNASLGVKGAW